LTIPSGEEKLRLWGKERRVVGARTVELRSWSGSGGGGKTLRHETRELPLGSRATLIIDEICQDSQVHFPSQLQWQPMQPMQPTQPLRPCTFGAAVRCVAATWGTLRAPSRSPRPRRQTC